MNTRECLDDDLTISNDKWSSNYDLFLTPELFSKLFYYEFKEKINKHHGFTGNKAQRQSKRAHDVHLWPFQTTMTKELVSLTIFPPSSSTYPLFMVICPWNCSALELCTKSTLYKNVFEKLLICIHAQLSLCKPFFFFLQLQVLVLATAAAQTQSYPGNISCIISAHYYFGKLPFCHLNFRALWLLL